jgi:hypothetical protein
MAILLSERQSRPWHHPRTYHLRLCYISGTTTGKYVEVRSWNRRKWLITIISQGTSTHAPRSNYNYFAMPPHHFMSLSHFPSHRPEQHPHFRSITRRAHGRWCSIATNDYSRRSWLVTEIRDDVRLFRETERRELLVPLTTFRICVTYAPYFIYSKCDSILRLLLYCFTDELSHPVME